MSDRLPGTSRPKVPPPASSGIEQEAGLAKANATADLSSQAELAGLRAGTDAGPESGLLSDASLLLRASATGPKLLPVAVLMTAVVIVLVGNMVGQVRLNEWNGTFYEAVGQRNLDDFLVQLKVFAELSGCLLALVVAQTWLQERLKIRIREVLTDSLFAMWLRPSQAYRLGFVGQAGAQPDQRIQEDCRVLSELTAELGVGMLQSVLLLVSFVGVLWSLSSYASFTFRGEEVVLKGYMVWVAVGYAAIGSGLTWAVGHPLIRLNTERYRREAEFRFAVVRVNESAESVSLSSGEADEKRSLESFFGAVLTASRRLSGALARLTWITSGYGWLAIVVPILAAAPGYFGGRLTFGEMMMVVGAFNQVQSALRYFVDHFPKFADWRAALARVAAFHRSAADLQELSLQGPLISVERHPAANLAFENLSVAMADGSIIIDDATAEVVQGERVLIKGASGSGKSTLLRAIAGLWPWGQGRILIPDPAVMLFLPQRPYLPLGTLRTAVSYPQPVEGFSTQAVEDALHRCGLDEFSGLLDRAARWDRTLSLGQQQRVAFARAVLHRPQWLFMDEATSALDEDSQASLLGLLETVLSGTTVLSIGHRPGLERFHTRSLQIRKTSEGSRLVALHAESRLPGPGHVAPGEVSSLSRLADEGSLATPEARQNRIGLIWQELRSPLQRRGLLGWVRFASRKGPDHPTRDPDAQKANIDPKQRQ